MILIMTKNKGNLDAWKETFWFLTVLRF